MKILILTTKSHIYANYVIKELARRRAFSDNEVIIFEQDWVIPYKNKLIGLMKYLKLSGFRYTIAQIMKQYSFILAQSIAYLNKKIDSYYYPYSKVDNRIKNEIVMDLRKEETFKHIKSSSPDVIISIFSREIIPAEIFRLPRFGCINIHPSLLPMFKGISPTFWYLAKGEKMAGISLHYVVEKIDKGGIIAQAEVSTEGLKTEHALYQKCTKKAVEMVDDFLSKLAKGEEVSSVSQEEFKSYFSIPKKKYVKIFRERGYSFFKFNEFIDF